MDVAVSLRNVNLNLLPVFHVLVNESNLSRAADILGMSQSAVSHALAKLRVQFRDPLFVRSGKGVEPTARALELNVSIGQALDLVRRGVRSTSAAKSPLLGPRFHCGVTDTLDEGPVFVSTIVEALRMVASEASPAFSYVGDSDWGKMLRLRQLDIVFDHEAAGDSDLESMLVEARHFSCFVRPENPLAQGEFTLERYLAATHVIMDAPDASPRSMLRVALHAAGLRRIIGARVHTHFHAALVASQSDHVGTGKSREVSFYAKQLGLCILKCPVETPPAPLFMTWLRLRTSDEGHRRLRQNFVRLWRAPLV
ncbi:MAG TPA: LysR family transcriptional regulator [Vineibacter sp.]|nr:LysR family transcriptional regulator [Vineibacter sp.]